MCVRVCQVVAAADEADGAGSEPRAAKAPRLDPAVELEALRRRVHALEHENERRRVAVARNKTAAMAGGGGGPSAWPTSE